MTRVLCSLILLTGLARTEVCVRPIYPFSTEEQVRVVVNELGKKKVQATVCGETTQETELWFYPLQVPMTGESLYWVTVAPVRGGFTGTVDTYTPRWNEWLWTLSVHPYGEIRSSKRVMGYSLKSQSGRLGKWLWRGK